MALTEATVFEAVLRRDRLVVVGALGAVAMTQMAGMPDMDMMMERAVWTLGYAGLIFAMWWVMMVAMMLPGAAPMLLLFARANRTQKLRDRPYVATGFFA